MPGEAGGDDRQAEDVILPVGVDGQVKEGVLSGLVLLMVFRPEAGDGQGFRIPVVLPGGQAVEGQVRIAGAVVTEAELAGPENRMRVPESDQLPVCFLSYQVLAGARGIKAT